MPLAKYAALFLFSFVPSVQGQKASKVELPDGATLVLPGPLFYEVDLVEREAGLAVLKGGKRNTPIVYFCIIKKDPPPKFEPIATILDATGQYRMETQTIGGSESDPNSTLTLRRITSPGPFQDFMIASTTLTYQNTVAGFLLLGPDLDFYQTIPDFRRMISEFQPPDINPGDSPVNPWIVFAAIGLLFLNTAIIWYGINRIAVHKKEN